MGGKPFRERCLHLTGGLGASGGMKIDYCWGQLHTVNRSKAKGALPRFRFMIRDSDVERHRRSGLDANLVGIKLYPMRIHPHIRMRLVEDLRKEIRPPVHPINPPLRFPSIEWDTTTVTGKNVVRLGIQNLLGHIAVARNRGPILGDKGVDMVPLFPE